MRRTVFAAIALAFGACTDLPVALDTDLQPAFARGAGGGIVHSATGGSHRFFNDAARTKRKFSFTAREHADGTFSGQFQLNIMGLVGFFGSENPAITRFLHAEVLCLSVEGNEAWIGGVIRSSSIPGNIGKETGFRVRDNGQGKSAPPDEISGTTFPLPDLFPPGHAAAWCEDQPLRGLLEVVQGNLQVR